MRTHCTMYSVHCTSCNIHIVQCILYTVHCTVYIVHCTHCTLYMYYKVYIVDCTMYSLQCTLCNTYTVYNVYIVWCPCVYYDGEENRCSCDVALGIYYRRCFISDFLLPGYIYKHICIRIHNMEIV